MTAMDRAYPYRQLEPLASNLLMALAYACHDGHLQIAGSLRRQRAWCHDIDLVAWPRYEQQGQVADLFGELRIQQTFTARRLAEAISRLLNEPFHIKANARMTRFIYQSVPVDIFFAEPDGSNYGALLQTRTGPAELNIKLAARAADMGLYYKAGHGLYSQEQRVDDGTEAGIFRMLGLRWVEPPQRDAPLRLTP